MQHPAPLRCIAGRAMEEVAAAIGDADLVIPVGAAQELLHVRQKFRGLRAVENDAAEWPRLDARAERRGERSTGRARRTALADEGVSARPFNVAAARLVPSPGIPGEG